MESAIVKLLVSEISLLLEKVYVLFILNNVPAFVSAECP